MRMCGLKGCCGLSMLVEMRLVQCACLTPLDPRTAANAVATPKGSHEHLAYHSTDHLTPLPQVFRPEDEVRGLVPASYVEVLG